MKSSMIEVQLADHFCGYASQKMWFTDEMSHHPARHCEEQSDEAIQCLAQTLDCFAPLAMT
jgi:hypothetical protein